MELYYIDFINSEEKLSFLDLDFGNGMYFCSDYEYIAFHTKEECIEFIEESKELNKKKYNAFGEEFPPRVLQDVCRLDREKKKGSCIARVVEFNMKEPSCRVVYEKEFIVEIKEG
jgi:hypothetical protein